MTKMEKFSAKIIIVVLYKTTLADSPTIQSLLNCQSELRKNDKICLWDNSPSGVAIDELDHLGEKFEAKIEYTNTPENLSLSKIYNNIIQANLGFEYVILFDQDSKFNSDFFSYFNSVQQRNKHINLFLPLIKTDKLIASPGDFRYFKGKYWSTPKYGVIDSKNVLAIASGLIIKTSTFQSVGYFDERLQLYGIDTNFMIRYSRNFDKLFVMDVYFNHDLSDFNIESTSTKLRRFHSHRASSILNSQLFSYDVKILTKLFFVYKSIQYTVKYKDLKFITSWKDVAKKTVSK